MRSERAKRREEIRAVLEGYLFGEVTLGYDAEPMAEELAALLGDVEGVNLAEAGGWAVVFASRGEWADAAVAQERLVVVYQRLLEVCHAGKRGDRVVVDRSVANGLVTGLYRLGFIQQRAGRADLAREAFREGEWYGLLFTAGCGSEGMAHALRLCQNGLGEEAARRREPRPPTRRTRGRR